MEKLGKDHIRTIQLDKLSLKCMEHLPGSNASNVRTGLKVFTNHRVIVFEIAHKSIAKRFFGFMTVDDFYTSDPIVELSVGMTSIAQAIQKYGVGEFICTSNGCFSTREDALMFCSILVNRELDRGNGTYNTEIFDNGMNRFINIQLPDSKASLILDYCRHRNISLGKFLLGILKKIGFFKR